MDFVAWIGCFLAAKMFVFQLFWYYNWDKGFLKVPLFNPFWYHMHQGRLLFEFSFDTTNLVAFFSPKDWRRSLYFSRLGLRHIDWSQRFLES